MLNILEQRRSIRRFSSNPVEREKIDILAKAALLGPCSRSNKTWTIIIVQNSDTIRKLSECRQNSSQFLYGAPVVMVLVGDPSVDTWIEDASIAATLIQTTAVWLGLGSCWCQVRNRFYSSTETSDQYIREILEIPDGYRVECMIGLGYPGEIKPKYGENDLRYDKIRQERFQD